MTQMTHAKLWATGLVTILVGLVVLSGAFFANAFANTFSFTVASPRSGLILEPGSQVRLYGLEIGKVESVDLVDGRAAVRVSVDESRRSAIPANIQADIRSGTVFGGKFVELVPPEAPSSQRLSAGSIVMADNVTTELNTVFEDLVGILNTVDPAKLNATLTAVAQGLQGRGTQIGETITATNDYLTAIDPLLPAIERQLPKVASTADTYSVAADDLLTTLRNATTTSDTIVDSQQNLDSLLSSAIGLSDTGTVVLAESGPDLVRTLQVLRPTSELLLKYDPVLTCTVKGLVAMGNAVAPAAGNETGYSLNVNIGIGLGKDAYTFPSDLPKIGATGGPGGQPGCNSSLPSITPDTFPVDYLVNDSGTNVYQPKDFAVNLVAPSVISYLTGAPVGSGIGGR